MRSVNTKVNQGYNNMKIPIIMPINQTLDLYNGAVNSKSDNDEDTEAPDLAIDNQRHIR